MRHGAGLFLVVIVVAAVAACGGSRHGSTDACFNSTALTDDERRSGPDFRFADLAGLRVVNDTDVAIDAPGGQDCRDFAAHAELVDDDGARIWLGATAILDEQQLLHDDLFARLDNATVKVDFSMPWWSTTSLVVTDVVDGVERLVVALQDGLDPVGEIGPLHVVAGGGTGLPVLNPCGVLQMRSLDFSDDTGVQSVWNEHSTTLRLDGAAYAATNIHTEEWSSVMCTDMPNTPQATWVVSAENL